ncbi:MAG: thiamine-phosphate kinase [Aciduliprofundum sp.]|nr:MAG: thiamine-phosphate kinase [Aciduliprofundum sp.]
MENMEMKDLGERKIIEELMRIFGTVVEDDSFYFDAGDSYILITTDVITRRTHIPEAVKPEQAGYFFGALNLSDIAAMGGRPRFFLSAYSVSRDFSMEYFLSFNRGLKYCLDKYSTKLVGGDMKEGYDFTAAGIVIGEVEKDGIMERRNFRPGQVVAVTNNLGYNAAGYYLWKNGEMEGADIMLKIEPRINEGRMLSRLGVRAAMDLSDGVFSAISQIKRQTGTGFRISMDHVPVHPLALEVSRRYSIPIEEISLNFGGEYELIFSVDPDIWDRVRKGMEDNGYMVREIGRTWEGENIIIKDGREAVIDERGYEHFS